MVGSPFISVLQGRGGVGSASQRQWVVATSAALFLNVKLYDGFFFKVDCLVQLRCFVLGQSSKAK